MRITVDLGALIRDLRELDNILVLYIANFLRW